MTRDIVPKLLPSVAGHYLLRHIELPASSGKWPGTPVPLPMGEVALRSNDGEGKPVSQEPPCSDKLPLCQSDTIAAPALLRQRPCPLRRFAPALPRGEPFQLHDTAPLRWNKWRSSYKLNDTSLNISCSPTWRSSPDWRSTFFASWAQVRHLGEVCFMALVR